MVKACITALGSRYASTSENEVPATFLELLAKLQRQIPDPTPCHVISALGKDPDEGGSDTQAVLRSGKILPDDKGKTPAQPLGPRKNPLPG